MKTLSATQRTKQLADHTNYGCTWIPALAKGERLCTVCGVRSFCPDCLPPGIVSYPSSVMIAYCSEHRRVEV